MTETSQALKSILDQAPKGSKTYALMDYALDSTIYPTVTASGCPAQNLYAETWQAGLNDIAPHLVELDPKSPFSSELLGWDWYGNWGYFVQSSASLSDVATPFQDMAVAILPDGQETFFRFVDPRVIRVFLPKLTTQSLKPIFNTANRLVVPTPDIHGETEGAIVYTLKNGTLTQSVTRFDS